MSFKQKIGDYNKLNYITYDFDDGCYVGVGEEVKFNICGVIYWDKCKGQCQIKHHVIIASTL